MHSTDTLIIFEFRGAWHGQLASARHGARLPQSIGWPTKAQATHELLLALDGIGQLPGAVAGHADKQAAAAFGVPRRDPRKGRSAKARRAKKENADRGRTPPWRPGDPQA